MRIRWKTQGRYKKAWGLLSLLLPAALLVGAATAQAEGTPPDLPTDPAKKELQTQIEQRERELSKLHKQKKQAVKNRITELMKQNEKVVLK